MVAATLIMLTLHFVVRFEHSRDARKINWAVLSLGLAAAVKVHFAVLTLPFLVWFWLARSRPWRTYAWRWFPVWLGVFVLCSPVPTFVQNFLHYGQATGPAEATASFAGAGPLGNLLLGTAAMGWQLFQPRINPLALFLKEPLAEWVTGTGLTTLAPRLEVTMSPVSMVDNASFGFLTSTLVATGLYLAFRYRRECLRQWPGWAALAGVAGFFLAVSRFLPSTVGRSSAGFVFLLFPLALVGWGRLSPRSQRGWVVLSVAASLLVLVMNPARPLWPVRPCVNWLEQNGHAQEARFLDPYVKVPQRAEAGRSLVRNIPADEPVFVALIGGEDPLLPTLTTDHALERVILLPANAPVEAFKETRSRYVLVSGMAVYSFPEICTYLEATREFELAQSAEYTCKLARGPQTWKLYRRKEDLSLASN